MTDKNASEPTDDQTKTIEQRLAELNHPCAQAYWNLDMCMDEKNNWWECREKVALMKRCWEDLESRNERVVKKDRAMIEQLKQIKRTYYQSPTSGTTTATTTGNKQ